MRCQEGRGGGLAGKVQAAARAAKAWGVWLRGRGRGQACGMEGSWVRAGGSEGAHSWSHKQGRVLLLLLRLQQVLRVLCGWMTVREVPVRCGLGCITFGKGLRPRGILAHADAHRLSSVPVRRCRAVPPFGRPCCRTEGALLPVVRQHRGVHQHRGGEVHHIAWQVGVELWPPAGCCCCCSCLCLMRCFSLLFVCLAVGFHRFFHPALGFRLCLFHLASGRCLRLFHLALHLRVHRCQLARQELRTLCLHLLLHAPLHLLTARFQQQLLFIVDRLALLLHRQLLAFGGEQ
mmetsp:Transcript_9872/g.26793  ORF Transcript_9872/g.26793 Transcript_9872/m.26793 type:complete len:290 (-) Transcript_9872:99-968(-)